MKASALAMLCLICNLAFAQDYEVRSASINSPEADFSGTFFNKDIIFCTNRAKTNLSFDEDSLTLYYTDLYIAKLKHDGTYLEPQPITGNVNTDFNEGHAAINKAGTKMYYTANLKTSLANKFEKTSEYKLGIFTAELRNGIWVNTGAFPYNAANSKYSVAHPSISDNDSILYFSSNMPGGYGQSDIYKCVWENGAWSNPQNLGSKVNTKGNEFFPFINEFNVLYFSTKSRSDSEGMDIYYSLFEENEFQKPVRLNNTINSIYDDFAYQERRGVNQGCFSSDRNGEQDDIYFFNKYLNTFKDCHENYTSNFCYHFFDEALAELGTLPIAYEWHMGDGTVLQGDSVDYCYKNYGQYHIVLNVIDTLTKLVFRKISETDVVINKQDKPLILSHDTIYSSIPFECKVEFLAFDEFEVSEIKWELDDGTKYEGESFTHTFDKPGKHQVKCGVTGKISRNGITPMVCVYKDIDCVVPDENVEPKALLCCDRREYEKITMRNSELATNIESKQLKKIFKLIIAESKEPLKSDDALLTRIDAEITEIKTDSSYQYAIQEAGTWQELLPTYTMLRDEGYTTMYTEEFSQSDLNKSVTKIIPRNPLNRIKIKSTNQAKLAAGSKLTVPNFSPSREEEILETNIPNDGTKPDSPIAQNNTDNSTIITGNAPGNLEKDSSFYAAKSIQQNMDSGYIIPDNNSKLNAYEGTIPINPNVKQSQESQKEITVDSRPIEGIQDKQVELTAIGTTQDQNDVTRIINPSKETNLTSVEDGTTLVNEKEPGESDEMIQNEASPIQNNSILSGQTSSTAIGAPQDNNILIETKDSSEKKLYKIILMRTIDRIPFNSPKFKTLACPIVELEDKGEYEYSIMAVPRAEDLNLTLNEVKTNGFNEAKIESFNQTVQNSKVLKTGKYIAPKDAKKLNVEFSKLSDIKFEYNSAEIKPESLKNLNYIAAMLKLEDDFTLKISAHTCSIGGPEYNEMLSEKRAKAVADYFAQKGISKERLIAEGFGQTKPIESNESEMGRAANRRVEFVIIFKINK